MIRVWTYIVANEGFIKRIFDYLSYMCMAFLASLFVRRVDVVIGTSPQFFTVCAAYLTSLCKRVPWVFELRDIWPESIRVVGAMKKSKILDWLEKVELFLYRKANVIVVVTNSFRTTLIMRGVDGDKVHVITNGVDIGSFSPKEKDGELVEQFKLKGKFVVGYIGTHGLAHALDTVLDSAKAIKETQNGDLYRFIFLGDGACKSALQQRAQAEKLDNIYFVDSVSKSEVVRYWSLLDASIIHLKKDELFTTVIPSKLFECMAMAIPVLHGVQGESAEIVRRECVGLMFESENSGALIQVLQSLAGDRSMQNRFKENGPNAAARYDRAALAKNMLKIIENLSRRHADQEG